MREQVQISESVHCNFTSLTENNNYTGFGILKQANIFCGGNREIRTPDLIRMKDVHYRCAIFPCDLNHRSCTGFGCGGWTRTI